MNDKYFYMFWAFVVFCILILGNKLINSNKEYNYKIISVNRHIHTIEIKNTDK